jgi:hypothetical protein
LLQRLLLLLPSLLPSLLLLLSSLLLPAEVDCLCALKCPRQLHSRTAGSCF